MLRLTSILIAAIALCAFATLPGCNTGGKKGDTDKGKEKPAHADEHPDGGPHGGPLAEWEPYHAEFTVDHPSKTAVIYILDHTAKKAPDVDVARFSRVKLTVTSETPIFTLDLTHDAKKSGPDGIAYVGTHEFFAKPVAFKGNLSAVLDEDGKKGKLTGLSDKFEYEPKKDGGDKKKSASVRELYLKPGGIYTVADIKANGNMVAADKFKGKVWEHEDKKPGDKVCPVTDNKAEKECAWIVQGQSYEFCCPPCVDKFIRWAHYEPAKVKDAKEYVFKRM